MDPGEQTTGTRDEHYNLISVLYHALHGAENCEMYAVDAEAAGKADLAAFFWEAQATQRQLAEQAKERLGIGGAAPPGPRTEAPPDAEPVDVRGRAAPEVGFPPEGMAGPEAPPVDVQRGTSPESPPPRGEERPPEPPPRPTPP